MQPQKSLKAVTEKAIDRLYNMAEDKELMQSIDLKDLKNLTGSIKELLLLSSELEPQKQTASGVIFLPEVNFKNED